MLKYSQKRETGIEFINETRPPSVGKHKKLATELNSKRVKQVKFDLFIQKTSAGDFDEQGNIDKL